MFNVANLDKYSKDIFDDIGKAIETYPLKDIENELQYTTAITDLTNTIFTMFRTVFDGKKNPGTYRNCFDERIRDKQNEYFQHPEFIGIYSEVECFDEEGPVDRTYFESICKYCELNGRDIQTIIRYFIVVKSLIAVVPIIGDYKRKPDIFQDDSSAISNKDKHTMTNEQKNQILKYLIENEDNGTLDGKVIGPLFGVRPDHVIKFVEKLDRSFGYIDYIGMAQYYFQIRTTPDGIEFYEHGGFKSEHIASADLTSNSIFNSTVTNISTSTTARPTSAAIQGKPYVFIGSSSEGLDVAKAIQANLNHVCEPHIWSQGLFGLSQGTLETLVGSLSKFDFAIFVLRSDDIAVSRNKEYNSPRDNVLLELGMFIGGIGKERTFMVVDRSAKIKLPSDLAGITPAFFDPPNKGTMDAAVGTACYQIELAFKMLGLRSNLSYLNSGDAEIDKKIITEYLVANNYTTISFELLNEMDPSYTQAYILSLVKTYPDHFRLARLKGKPGIALSKFII